MIAPQSSPRRPGKAPMIAFFTQVAEMSPFFESPVQSTKAWRAQDKAEQGAGFVSAKELTLIDFFTCDLCGIGIGPQHYEKELYYLPILSKKEILGEDPWLPERRTQVTARTLRVCGGCARHRKLPETYLLFPEQLWLLSAQEISAQIQLIDRFLKWMDHVLIIIWFAFHGSRLAQDVTIAPLSKKTPVVNAMRRTFSSFPLPSLQKSAQHPLSALMSLPTPRSGFMLA